MGKSKGHNPRLFDTLVKVPDFNIQVSQSKSRNDARAESVVAVNPLNSSNLVGASKEFTDIQNYEFTLAAYYSVDGGLTWNQSPALELMRGSHNLSDPAMAWDNAGNAYLFGLPLGPAPGLNFQGLVVYKSSDGGRNWGRPTLINQTLSSDPNVGDDKPWAVGDYNPASPHFGNVYVAWDDIQPGADGTWLVFARSTDHGNHWRGLGNQPITALGGVTDSFSPELAVGPDGILYIFWIAGSQIKFMRSADGGDTFSAPAVAVSGLSPSTFWRRQFLPGVSAREVPGRNVSHGVHRICRPRHGSLVRQPGGSGAHLLPPVHERRRNLGGTALRSAAAHGRSRRQYRTRDEPLSSTIGGQAGRNNCLRLLRVRTEAFLHRG